MEYLIALVFLALVAVVITLAIIAYKLNEVVNDMRFNLHPLGRINENLNAINNCFNELLIMIEDEKGKEK